MSKRKKKIRTTEQAIEVAKHLLKDGLPQRFAVLANRQSPLAARREAAEFTAAQFVPLCVAIDARAFSPDECSQLAHGLWNAASVAPAHSKTEGLNAVMWEHALAGVYSGNEKEAVTTTRQSIADPALKKRGVQAKILANHLHFFGMIWRPENWGATPLAATRCFNRTAAQLKAHLHPNSRQARELDEVSADLARWRRAQSAAKVNA